MGEGSPQSRAQAGDRRASERLDSWKEIAAYLKREIRTVQRWEKSLGLPIRRLADQQGVFAYKSELDIWWRERETKIQEEEAEADRRAFPAPTPPETATSNQIPEETLIPGQRHSKPSPYLLVSVALALLLVVMGLREFGPRIQEKFWPQKGRVMLAVVPFKNLSGDPEAQRIAEGLTEETISGLSRLRPRLLGVVELPPPSAALGPYESDKSLKTDYLLEGTVRRAGDKVGITASLILVKDQTRIWGDSYERDLQNLQDIIAVEIEVADALAKRALNQLPHDAEPASAINRDAFEAYLEGRFFWNKRTTESLTKAVSYFQKAIQYDSAYAPAYAGLADCYSLLGSAPFTALAPKEAFLKSEEAARKALELDSSLAEAHVSLGYSELVYHRDFIAAKKEFQEAIRLRPAYPTAHQYYGYYLTSIGRLDEAIKEREVARELDPLSPLMNSALGEAFYQAREFDRTIEQNQKSLELDPSYAISLVNLGRAFEQQGKYELALDTFGKILAADPDDPAVLGLVGHADAASGRRTDAHKILSKLEQVQTKRYVPALYFAMIYTGLNDKDKSFAWLDKAYEEHCEYLVYLPTEPMADPLRGDPRFSRLLSRLGLKPVATLAALRMH
jgi:TolB-like protein/Tfp pilus assembly protein PilF